MDNCHTHQACPYTNKDQLYLQRNTVKSNAATVFTYLGSRTCEYRTSLHRQYLAKYVKRYFSSKATLLSLNIILFSPSNFRSVLILKVFTRLNLLFRNEHTLTVGLVVLGLAV